VTVSSGSNSSVGSATTTGSTGDIVITSGGSASLTQADSARDLSLSAPLVFVSTVDAARDVFITGTTGATVTNRIFAGDDLEVTATSGNVAAGGATLRSLGLGQRRRPRPGALDRRFGDGQRGPDPGDRRHGRRHHRQRRHQRDA
jgi:hypothetical protein